MTSCIKARTIFFFCYCNSSKQDAFKDSSHIHTYSIRDFAFASAATTPKRETISKPKEGSIQHTGTKKSVFSKDFQQYAWLEI